MNPTQILADDEGHDTSVAPLVGASLELMTPSPFDGWLRPRLFLHGDGAAAFSFERNVAGVEAPKESIFTNDTRSGVCSGARKRLPRPPRQ